MDSAFNESILLSESRVLGISRVGFAAELSWLDCLPFVFESERDFESSRFGSELLMT